MGFTRELECTQDLTMYEHMVCLLGTITSVPQRHLVAVIDDYLTSYMFFLIEKVPGLVKQLM